MPRSLAAAAALSALSLCAPRAQADDGVYGRLDGDLDLSIGAGAGYTAEAPILVARAAAFYAATAGLYFNYAEAFDQPEARTARSLAAGVALRPLFWARFANAVERGPAHLDLFIDSFSFEIGAFWSSPPAGTLREEPGFELAASIGFPFLANASGPWIELRTALRYRPQDLASSSSTDLGDRGAIISLSFAWHQVVSAHIADLGDSIDR